MSAPQSFDLVVLQRVGAFGGSERHTLDLLTRLAEGHRRVAFVESGKDEISSRLGPHAQRICIVKTDLPMRGVDRSVLSQWRTLLAAVPAERALLVKPWFYAADRGYLSLLRRLYFSVIHLEHCLVPELCSWSHRIHFSGRPRTGLWWYRDAFSRWRMSRTADRVIAVSQAALDSIVRYAFVEKKRIAVCKNGVDTARWKRDPAAGQAFRQSHGIPDEAYVFGCVGRLAPEKGIDLAIEALGIVARQGANKPAVLCVVGDGPCLAELRQLAADRGLASSVKLVGAVADPVPAYSAIDTLLMPSHHESFGLALVEAMACECRTIAAAVGGVPEVLCGADFAGLLATRDAQAWADQMLDHIAASKEERSAAGRRGRAFVVRHHDQAARLRRLESVLLEPHWQADGS